MRGRLFGATLGLIVAGQLLALFDMAGLRVPWPAAAFVIASALSPLVGALALSRKGEAPAGWARWALVSWALWAGTYYAVAFVASRREAIELPMLFEQRLAVSPSWVLVYLGVHPLSLLPYLGLEREGELRAHFAGQSAIVGLSALCWLLVPVTMPRAELPDDPGSIGRWALVQLRGSDPSLNCLPSTHCAVCIHGALSLLRLGPAPGAFAVVTFIAIAASTLLTRQHYAIDVAAGTLLGVAAHIASMRRA